MVLKRLKLHHIKEFFDGVARHFSYKHACKNTQSL